MNMDAFSTPTIILRQRRLNFDVRVVKEKSSLSGCLVKIRTKTSSSSKMSPCGYAQHHLSCSQPVTCEFYIENAGV